MSRSLHTHNTLSLAHQVRCCTNSRLYQLILKNYNKPVLSFLESNEDSSVVGAVATSVRKLNYPGYNSKKKGGGGFCGKPPGLSYLIRFSA
jgi:hypothetical protein